MDEVYLVKHVLWLGKQFLDINFTNKRNNFSYDIDAQKRPRETEIPERCDNKNDASLEKVQKNLFERGRCKPWEDAKGLDRDKIPCTVDSVTSSNPQIEQLRQFPKEQIAYRNYVETFLKACKSSQQRKIVREVLSNTKQLSIAEKYSALQNVKEGFNIEINAVDVPVAAVESLKKQHTELVDNQLKQKFRFYEGGTVNDILDGLEIHGAKLNLRNCTTLNQFSSALKRFKCITPTFPPEAEPNGIHFNVNLKNHAIGKGLMNSPTIFDAASLHLAQDESLSTVLRILTYKELQDSHDSIARYCEQKGYNVRDLPNQILNSSAYATPPVINLLAKNLQKHIIVHWGTYDSSQDAFSFGNPKNPNMHLIALDTHFYPVYNIKGSNFEHFNFKNNSKVLKAQNIKGDVSAIGTDLIPFVKTFTTPCNICNDFKILHCGHITNRQVEELSTFRNVLQNTKFGALSAEHYDNWLHNPHIQLDRNNEECVVPIDVNADEFSLFNAVSQSLFGTESLSSTLRKVVAIDFFENEAHYTKEFAKSVSAKQDFIAMRKNIYSNHTDNFWEDEYLLLLSRITSRRIVVIPENFSAPYCKLYNMSPTQSRHFNPILLVRSRDKSYCPAIALNWENFRLPASLNTFFEEFNPPQDVLEHSEGILLNVTQQHGSLSAVLTSQSESKGAQACMTNCMPSTGSSSTTNVPEASPQPYENSTPQPLIQKTFESANKVVQDKESKDSVPQMEEKLQTNQSASRPKNITLDDLNEFMEIVGTEMDRMIKHGAETNVLRFTQNIMGCEKQFWKFRLDRLGKYKKHSACRINAKAQKFLHFSRSEFAREKIATKLAELRCSPTTVQLYEQHSSEIFQDKYNKSHMRRRKHAREIERITNSKCDYKLKTTYQDYVTGQTISEAEMRTPEIEDLIDLNSSIQGGSSSHEETNLINFDLLQQAPINEKDNATELEQLQGSTCTILPERTFVKDKHPKESNIAGREESNNAEIQNSHEDASNCQFPENDETETHCETTRDSVEYNDEETSELAKQLGFENELKYVPPKNFSFHIPASEMAKIYNYEDEKFLFGKWPCTISKHVTEIQKCCSFKALKAVTYYERRNKNGFCKMVGSCNADCKLTFSIKLLKAPVRGQPVTMHVTSNGEFKLIQNKPTGRQLRSFERKRMGMDLKYQKAVKVFTKNTCKMRKTPHRLLHNNHRQRSKDVLSTIRAENVKKQVTSTDPRDDVYAFAKETKDNDTLSKYIKGYVHHNNEIDGETTIHLYTEQDLKILNMCCKNSKVTLHLDATGSIVKTPTNKQMLLYTIIARTSRGVNFPVADMLSQRGRAVDIGNFLNKLKSDARLCSKNPRIPFGHVIVTDFSFAMLNGVSSGANGMLLKDYLKDTWDILNNRKSLHPDRSVLIICKSHLIKAVSRLMSKHLPNVPKNKQVRSLAIHAVTRTQECKDIMSLRNTMEKICEKFGKKTISSEELDLNKAFLTSREDTLINDIIVTESNSEPDDDFHKELMKSSPFYQMFENLRGRYTSDETSSDGIVNPFYNRKILDLIHKHYIPYVPLYSDMMLQKTGRSEDLGLTNAPIEAEFNVVKNFLHDEGKTQYNSFIRRHHVFHQGRVLHAIPLSQKQQLSKTEKIVKLKRLQKPKLPESAEERWGRGKKRKENKYAKRRNSKATASPVTAVENINSLTTGINDRPLEKPGTSLTESERMAWNKLKETLTESGENTPFANLAKTIDEIDNEQEQMRLDLEEIERCFNNYIENDIPVDDMPGLPVPTKRTVIDIQLPNEEELHDLLLDYDRVFQPVDSAIDESVKSFNRLTRFGENKCGDSNIDGFLRYDEIQYMLDSNNKLDDTQVDFYMSMLIRKYPESGFVISKSHYVHKSLNLDHESKVKPYTWQTTQLVEGFPYDAIYEFSFAETSLILHPLRVVNHWKLLGIDKVSKTCVIFDSGRPTNPELQRRSITETKQYVLQRFLNSNDNIDTWNVRFDNLFVRQYDVFSCGTYCLAAAKEILSRKLVLKSLALTDSMENVLPQVCDPAPMRHDQVREILSTTLIGQQVLNENGDDNGKLIDFFSRNISEGQHKLK